MALGDYNNNNSKKYYEPVVYSQYGTSNVEGVDPSALSYQFYNGLLKISIAPMKVGAKPGDRNLWDYDSAISVWLTHTKARILHDEVLYVLNNPDTAMNGGVPAGGEGLISFSNGKEVGASSPCLIIRKIDPNNGSVTSVYAYQFRDKHHASVRNFDSKNPQNYDSYTYSNLEIDQLLTILDEYARSATGAYAYSTLYAMKYDINRNNAKLQLIMDKLGVESSNAEYNRNRGGNSFFSNNNRASSSSTEKIPGNDNSMKSMSIDQLGEEDE